MYDREDVCVLLIFYDYGNNLDYFYNVCDFYLILEFVFLIVII